MNTLAERIEQHIDDNGSYIEGLRLLAEIQTPAVLLRICSVSDNSFTRNKIRELLQAYCSGQEAKVLPKAERVQNAKKQLLPSESQAAPSEVQNAIKKRNELYGYCRELHGQMKLMVFERHKFSDEERRLVRQDAERSWKEIDRLWKFTSYFDENKEVKPSPEEIEKVEIVGDNELKHRLMTLRTYTSPSYVSRINNAEKTAEHWAERTQTEKRLEKLRL